MAARSDSSLAALLLSQRLVDTPVAPLKSAEYWALLDSLGDPAALLGLDTAGIAGTTGVDPALADRLARLLDAATSFAIHLDQAEQSGLRVIASVDESYPRVLIERLGRSAPPLLYAVGDPALLTGETPGHRRLPQRHRRRRRRGPSRRGRRGERRSRCRIRRRQGCRQVGDVDRPRSWRHSWGCWPTPSPG